MTQRTNISYTGAERSLNCCNTVYGMVDITFHFVAIE